MTGTPGRPPHAWTQAVYDLLSDGEWHTYEEAIEVAMAQVRPEQAVRQREKRRTYGTNEDSEIYNKDADQKVLTGKKDLARRCIHFAILRNRIELKTEGDKKYVRASDPGRDQE